MTAYRETFDLKSRWGRHNFRRALHGLWLSHKRFWNWAFRYAIHDTFTKTKPLSLMSEPDLSARDPAGKYDWQITQETHRDD